MNQFIVSLIVLAGVPMTVLGSRRVVLHSLATTSAS
jgi:hypothetical protein